MTEDDDDRSGHVDRRAFLTGAGKRSASAATSSGGLLGWAIRRAREANARDDERTYLEDEVPDDDATLESRD